MSTDLHTAAAAAVFRLASERERASPPTVSSDVSLDDSFFERTQTRTRRDRSHTHAAAAATLTLVHSLFSLPLHTLSFPLAAGCDDAADRARERLAGHAFGRRAASILLSTMGAQAREQNQRNEGSARDARHCAGRVGARRIPRLCAEVARESAHSQNGVAGRVLANGVISIFFIFTLEYLLRRAF